MSETPDRLTVRSVRVKCWARTGKPKVTRSTPAAARSRAGDGTMNIPTSQNMAARPPGMARHQSACCGWQERVSNLCPRSSRFVRILSGRGHLLVCEEILAPLARRKNPRGVKPRKQGTGRPPLFRHSVTIKVPEQGQMLWPQLTVGFKGPLLARENKRGRSSVG